MATLVEKISFSNNGDNSDSISQFKWLSRSKCYVEGSAKGFLKIRDIEKQGECMLMLAGMQFTDKIQAAHYSSTRNLLFIGGKDGKFFAWKLPNEWRQPWVDKFEQDY